VHQQSNGCRRHARLGRIRTAGKDAYFWLDLAAAGKVAGLTPDFAVEYREGMRKTRDEAASHLTPADLSRVQERARKWFNEHPAKPQ